MLYFDTSFLVPLLIPEATSEQVEAFLHALPSEQTLLVSQWTKAEFGSVLSRLVRMRQLDPASAAACAAQFDLLLDESFELVTPTAADFEHCWKILTRFDTSLRAGDALHLAIAANRKVTAVYSLDNGMLSAGKRLKLPVHRGIS